MKNFDEIVDNFEINGSNSNDFEYIKNTLFSRYEDLSEVAKNYIWDITIYNHLFIKKDIEEFVYLADFSCGLIDRISQN